jgi:hypothetical protein
MITTFAIVLFFTMLKEAYEVIFLVNLFFAPDQTNCF